MLSHSSDSEAGYSVVDGARHAIAVLLESCSAQLPSGLTEHLKDVVFSTATDGRAIYFPCPFKETEASAALKAIEGSAIAAIADARFGKQKRKIDVNLERTAGFLFSTYIATIGGMSKADPAVKAKLKGERRCRTPPRTSYSCFRYGPF